MTLKGIPNFGPASPPFHLEVLEWLPLCEGPRVFFDQAGGQGLFQPQRCPQLPNNSAHILAIWKFT